MTAFQNGKSSPVTSLQLYQLFSIVPSLHLNGLSFLSSGTSLQVTNDSKDDGGYRSYTQNLINLKNNHRTVFLNSTNARRKPNIHIFHTIRATPPVLALLSGNCPATLGTFS